MFLLWMESEEWGFVESNYFDSFFGGVIVFWGGGVELVVGS